MKKDDFGYRYELFRKCTKKYVRLKMDLVEPNHQWQMDLANLKYLEKYNSNIRYLLVVIDTHSRYAWIKKFKNKYANMVGLKFEEIVEEANDLPKHVHSDRGGEFSIIKQKCEDGSFGNNIKYSSSENYEMKSVMVERFIRTLKFLISNVLYGLYGKCEGRYTNILDKIVECYNKTPYDVYKS